MFIKFHQRKQERRIFSLLINISV